MNQFFLKRSLLKFSEEKFCNSIPVHSKTKTPTCFDENVDTHTSFQVKGEDLNRSFDT